MRAYQKRVIFLKNTGSEIFEEAYFILNPEKDAGRFSRADMVKEAEKIVRANFSKKRHIKLSTIVAFLIGSLLSAGIMLAMLL